jgi:hypothetical protein
MSNIFRRQTAPDINSLITRQANLPGMALLNKIADYTNKFHPGTIPAAVSPVVTRKKFSNNESALHLHFNIFLKQIAARLSDIELALNCYDVSNIKFSTHILKDLFIDMHMPEAYRLTGQMELFAEENEMTEVNKVLRNLKNTIAQAVKNRQNK